MDDCMWIVRSVDECVSTNAKYGFIMNHKGCFEPIDDDNIDNVKLFDSEKKARKACRNLTNVSVERVFVESQVNSKN